MPSHTTNDINQYTSVETYYTAGKVWGIGHASPDIYKVNEHIQSSHPMNLSHTNFIDKDKAIEYARSLNEHYMGIDWRNQIEEACRIYPESLTAKCKKHLVDCGVW